MSTKFTTFKDIVNQRRAVRGFTSQAVDEGTVRELVELAARAPSNCNTQPWHIAIAAGATTERLKTRLTNAMDQGQIQMDIAYDGSYENIWRERQHEAARLLYQAMGIARDDRAGRQAAFMRNFAFFGAPQVAFFFLPKPFGLREAADLGMFAQTFMLALTARDLASCPQTALSFNADIVRSELNVDPSMQLLFGIAFGFEDSDVAANSARTPRAESSTYMSYHN